MEGRRFGAGLAVGLAFALVIVGVSGFVASAGSLSSNPTAGGGQQTIVSSTNTATSTLTTTPTFTFAGSSQPQTSASGNLLSSTAKPPAPNVTAATNGQGYVPAQEFSSSLASLNQLPTASRALLLAPVLAAFLLGALLYRASTRGRADSEEA